MPESFRAPRALTKGGRIAVIAPSSPFDEQAFDEGVRRLRRRYDVRYDAGLLSRTGFLAGDDARRLAELTGALADPDVDAIVAARGGYGATRLFAGLEVERVAAAAKLLVGFSDLTALHGVWARSGLRSVHGPMVAALGRCDEALVQRWISIVEGAVPEPISGLRSVCGGHARGPLLGGNLAVLAAMVGSGFMPPLDGAVLFLEDTGERPYRVDRMLTTLRNAGHLSGLRAVVLGAFCDCEPNRDGVRIEEVLAERLSTLGIPVLAGAPAGHIEDNLELVFGAEVEVDGDLGRVNFRHGVRG